MSGHRYFDTVDDALEAFNLSSDNVAVVREHLAEHDYEPRCYIVGSGQYIGLTPLGGGTIDYINRGFIHYRDESGVLQVKPMPTNSIRDGGYAQSGGAKREAQACGQCGQQMPLSGVCDFC